MRIYAKLWRLYNEDERLALIPSADIHYPKLYNEAHKRLDSWNGSNQALVYCGNFLAANSEYNDAAKIFMKLLDTASKTDDDKLRFSRICHKYVKVVLAGDLIERRCKAKRACRKAIGILKAEHCVPERLQKKLKDCQERLSHEPSALRLQSLSCYMAAVGHFFLLMHIM